MNFKMIHVYILLFLLLTCMKQWVCRVCKTSSRQGFLEPCCLEEMEIRVYDMKRWYLKFTTKPHMVSCIAGTTDSSKGKPKTQLWIYIIIAKLYCFVDVLGLDSVLLL